MNAPTTVHEMKIMTQLPDMGSGPIPVEPYVSADYFEKEREKVFKRAWINVGHVNAHIPNPGDYMVREVDFLGSGKSIILVHGRDGVVRAFHNICTHRGNVLAKGSGNVRTAFICGIHGWSFGLDGSLRPVPSEDQFPTLNRAEYGLPPVTTDVWKGFIFINDQEKPETSLLDFLGGMAGQLKDMPFDDYRLIQRCGARLKCNWKVYVDAFQETYHVSIVHAESLTHMAADPNMYVPTSIRTYGPHRSISAWADPEHKPTPAEAIAWKHNGAAVTPKAGREKDSWTNPGNDDHWWFDINVIFPNVTFLVGTGWFLTYSFYPINVDETYWEMNLYQLPASTPGQKIAQQLTASNTRDFQYEDLSTMEGVHAGLKTGVMKTFLPGEFEVCIRHQRWAIEQWINAK